MKFLIDLTLLGLGFVLGLSFIIIILAIATRSDMVLLMFPDDLRDFDLVLGVWENKARILWKNPDRESMIVDKADLDLEDWR